MAEVWSAEGDPSVALKLLSLEAAREPRLARAVRTEVRIAAGLCSPHVVGILDTGQVRIEGVEVPWIALERAEGSLDAVDEEQVHLREVLVEVLRGLAHAHAHSVLHRDVKPANVLRLDGRWMLSDFGLASNAESRTLRGGSPGYAAPEQLQGLWWEEGPWTDVYAVGAIAWALCNGRAPEGPSDLDGGSVPEDLASWIARAGAYRAEDRFPHAADALAALPTTIDPSHRVALSRSESSASSTQYFFDDGPIPEAATAPTIAPIAAVRHPLPDPPPPDALPSRPRPALQRMVPQPLPGQEGAREALWEGLRRADRGERAIVRLHGEPGSGRHEVLSRVLAKAHESGAATVVRLRASPLRTVRAHDLARTALGALDESLAECERVGEFWRIDEPGLHELLNRYLPRHRLHTPTRTWAAFGRVLARRADARILVLAIEEVQYATEFLMLLADGLEHLPPRTLIALTTSEGGSAAAQTLLDRLPAPAVLSRVRLHDGGELLPWQDAVDASLGLPAPADRLAELPPAARSAIEVGAILGRDLDQSLWVDVAERAGRPDPREALPELLAEGWIAREGRERWLIRSEALRGAAVDQLSEEDRRALHGSAADVLLERAPSRALALHLLALGRKREAARAWYSAHLEHSTLRALALQELEDRVATDPPDTTTALVWAMRAHTAALAGDREAHTGLLARLEAIEGQGDRVVDALAAFTRAWGMGEKNVDDLEWLVEHDDLLNLPPGMDDWWPVSQFTLLRADQLWSLERLEEARAMGELARDQAWRDKHRVNAVLHLAQFVLHLEGPAAATPLLDELDEWQHAMTGSMRSVAHQIRAFSAEMRGDIEAAERQMGASVELREQMGLSAPYGRIHHATYLAELGRMEEARKRFEEQEPPPGTEPHVWGLEVALAAHDDAPERLRALLDEAPEFDDDIRRLLGQVARRLDSTRPILAARCAALAGEFAPDPPTK